MTKFTGPVLTCRHNWPRKVISPAFQPFHHANSGRWNKKWYVLSMAIICSLLVIVKWFPPSLRGMIGSSQTFLHCHLGRSAPQRDGRCKQWIQLEHSLKFPLLPSGAFETKRQCRWEIPGWKLIWADGRRWAGEPALWKEHEFEENGRCLLRKQWRQQKYVLLQ